MSEKTRAELKEQIKIMNHNYQVIREMHERGCQYSVSEIKRLQDELERTRKALAFAKSKLNGIHRLYSKAFYTREDWLQVCMEMVDKANTALEQITALEQKDK